MPTTAITVQTAVGPYPATVSADDLDFTWTAADVANGNHFASTGRELILVRNDDVAAQTITITSQVDAQNRKQDITAYSMGIGEYAVFQPALLGWANASNEVLISGATATIFFAILRY